MKSKRVRILVGLFALVVAVLAVVVYFAPVTVGVATMRAGLQVQGFERNSIDTEAGEVVYFADGSGETLLFVHGLQDQAGGWWRVAPEFTDDYRVIVPDLIGHGESGPRDGAIHPNDAIVQLGELLEETASSEPVTLIGNSMGGGISLGFALLYPERVRRLILIDSAGLQIELVRERFLPQDINQLRKTLRLVLGPDATLPPDFVLRSMKTHVWNGPTPRLWDHFADGSAFLDELLPGLEVPADIVWGTYDKLIPIEVGRRMHELLPRSRFHPMEGCGHAPQVGCTARLVALLETILEQPPPD